MKVVIAAGGSRGDVQPMLALALALRDRGHLVRLCAAPNFEGWITGHGVPFRSVGRDVQAFLTRVGVELHKALRHLEQDLRREFAVLGEVIADADLLVGASVTCAGVSHAERRGIPCAYVMYSPSLLPSSAHPAPTCRFQRLPRWMNRLTWAATRRLWNTLFRGIIDDERAKLGLGPIADTWAHVQTGSLMLAAEPALLRPAADAPVERIVQTGALFLPERDELPPALERFCAAGPPPVYIGFGSMPDRDPARSTAMLVEAIRRAGVRAVIGRGWAGLGGVELPPEVHVVDDVPHGKLFPLLGAVVHHGGTGTTSNAARAGIPQVLVPHLLDQFYVADRLGPLGLGPRAIPRKRLTVARLAHALAEVVGDPGCRERAGALAQQVVRDGVERAVVMLEELGAGRPVRATVSAAG